MGNKKDKTTFGTLAVAMFWLVILSGVLLAVPFNVESPYQSVSTVAVTNPWGAFIRNFHYWSSQFFLIFSLVHLYDHFHKKDKIGLKTGMAFRLSIGVLIIFLAMITGFLLKGDADSVQARQILHTLAERVPLIGESLAFSLLGHPESYQLIYVHHIATFTVFIAVIIIEHSRKKYWPPLFDFVISVIGVLAFSYFFSAPLHDNLNPAVKGPWYFVGFQEILHWLSQPEWSLLLFLALLILIFLVNSLSGKTMFFSKRSLLLFTAFYFVLTVIGLFFRGERWQWKYPWQNGYNYEVLNNFKAPRVLISPEFELETAMASPLTQGRKEACLACHTETHGLVDSHSPEAIGCVSCHGGNPFATAKKQAHQNMILIPGNLATARQSCGTTQCHPEIVERVPTGLMATLSGMISVDRFVFNEQDSPDILTNVHSLGNSAADEHLRNLCVRCHLGNPKTEYGPINESSRGGGCLACHLNYSHEAEAALAMAGDTIINAHPSISLAISNNHCFGCHSRSGRISTSFEGWHETTLLAEEMPQEKNYRLIEGERVFVKKQADVHHQLGMECIDCHHSYEVMGDGNLYAHQEDQADVQCSDCHFLGKARTIRAENLDNESAIIAALRLKNSSDKQFLLTEKRKHALVNTFVENDTAFLQTKNSGIKMVLSPPAEVCSRNNAHSKLACSSCHSSWVPTCIGCHNEYDPHEPSYNMVANKEQTGGWVEFFGEYQAKLPSLGMRTDGDKTEIIPVAPGMILTIDKSTYTNDTDKSTIFHRLYAPVAPHTTTKEGRDCKSCHNSSLALGYGEGKLEYKITDGKGKWTFSPLYQRDENDGLPADAWIDFLQTRTGKVATRSNVSPLNIEQQKSMLTVGACLTCHDDNSAVMKVGLANFEAQLQQRTAKCIVPDWN
ncbi:cytochrome b N-terminal domain-containing protein [uncultured Draconibacterium sp.]|uniref:cytochrome b N-terminal domain-containing protein n=1 Tax=uncultured Draconibacterium sp. TaxID=1573823 RepID=UPI00326097C9